MSQDHHQARLAALLPAFAAQKGGLLPLLQALQREVGYIPPACVADIARAFGVSRAEVQGVISFYRDFRSEPPARHCLRLCLAEACLSMGAATLAGRARARLGAEIGARSADGRWQLEGAYCLGACACAPALQLDGELHARVGPEQLQRLLDDEDEPC
ncbi:formate dehydrogenase [Xenophilus sp. AP218F]|nr:NAD(P)H-dependent oxidoreductase subunit E [Chromobacterium sp. ASV5]OWY40448.1 formate dehydrogenase [Xenophilus sp. AP218F]